MNGELRIAVVTGGGGFVGLALTRRLRELGIEVRTIQRNRYAELGACGAIQYTSDLGDPQLDLGKILNGADVVFHTAAKVDMWGPYEDFYQANVQVTQRLLDAARQAGVRRFVFTSSPSVIARHENLCGVDESQPYPPSYLAHYPATKAEAERKVLSANTEDFKTLALRPHLIFGPGDRHLIPTVLERARAGKLPQIGAGQNRSDFCFINDCVEAHLCAARALDINPNAAGKPYFITQGEPVSLWGWIHEVVRRSGIAPIRSTVPARLAYTLAFFCEMFSRILPSLGEPRLTRFLVSQMSTEHFFSIEAARSQLGFTPHYSMRESLDLTFEAPPTQR
jgi:nucleoside-diphosphate-sugar epimerase